MEKLASGIVGFDDLCGGGVPTRGMVVVQGPPGSGKTIFALQHAALGGPPGTPAAFLSFEERPAQLEASLRAFGWADADASPVRLVDARPSLDAYRTGPFDISGLLARATERVRAGARRIVLDGIDGLLDHIDDAAVERREFARLYRWVDEVDASCLITTRRLPRESWSRAGQRQAMIDFLADVVIDLGFRSTAQSTMRDLHIGKYRSSPHSTRRHPMAITDDGLLLGATGSILLEHPASSERIASGIPRLDTMLGGGIFRGSTVLVTGSPGTAKTTLGAAWALASAERDETALFVSFDESPAQIRRNMASVGLDLEAAARSERLRQISFRSSAIDLEYQYGLLEGLVDEVRPALVVIDPLTALMVGEVPEASQATVHRVISLLKSRGITAILPAITRDPLPESTPLHVSTIADSWIHLSFSALQGERNRALTIVKARGTDHSHQVRELLLGPEGPTLADVYTRGSEVLMGTARIEEEQAERERSREKARRARQHQEDAELERDELLSRVDALSRRAEVLDRRSRRVDEQEATDEAAERVHRDRVRRSRHGDDEETR